MAGYKVAPLKGSMMIIALLGIVVSLFVIYPMRENQNIDFNSEAWGAAFALVSGIVLIASVISMTYGPPTEELHIEEKRKSGAASKKAALAARKPGKRKKSKRQ